MNKKNIKFVRDEKTIKPYVEQLTRDLDNMAEKMANNKLDVDSYHQWFSLVCSALDLIKDKSKKTIN